MKVCVYLSTIVFFTNNSYMNYYSISMESNNIRFNRIRYYSIIIILEQNNARM
jgi:hypothetical protein